MHVSKLEFSGYVKVWPQHSQQKEAEASKTPAPLTAAQEIALSQNSE